MQLMMQHSRSHQPEYAYAHTVARADLYCAAALRKARPLRHLVLAQLWERVSRGWCTCSWQARNGWPVHAGGPFMEVSYVIGPLGGLSNPIT